MPHASLAIILHAHLPYLVNGPQNDWLFEAMAETYVPLLDMLERLPKREQGPILALSLSPTLCEMLSASDLADRFLHYVQQRIEIAQRAAQDASAALSADAARFHVRFYQHIRSLYESRYAGRMLQAFAELSRGGQIELLTTAATHAVLPLLATRQSLHAQVAIACANHEKHFGRRPRAFWLPECAYSPGIETALAGQGIDCFVVAPHAFLHAEPRPLHGPYAPALCPNRVAAFALDIESAKQVWSRQNGYPGDPWYREFHRDVGFDAAYDDIESFLHHDGVRRSLGVRCFRITGDVPLHAKLPYEPERAFVRAQAHAADFVQRRVEQTQNLAKDLQFSPLVMVGYDAELFGHWWFEGVAFLEEVLKRVTQSACPLALTTPVAFLEQAGQLQCLQPAESTWGRGGYFTAWVDPVNDWIYLRIHAAEEAMAELAQMFPDASDLTTRALKQAGRELLLAQSSDWAFMMSQGETGDYGAERFRLHIGRFTKLAEQTQRGEIEAEWLAQIEEADAVFPEMDYRAWASN